MNSWVNVAIISEDKIAANHLLGRLLPLTKNTKIEFNIMDSISDLDNICYDVYIVCSPNCNNMTCPKIIKSIARKKLDASIFLISECDICKSLKHSDPLVRELLDLNTDLQLSMNDTDLSPIADELRRISKLKMDFTRISAKLDSLSKDMQLVMA